MSITRDTDENGLRWYRDGDVAVMSVTTVLGFLEEDTTGLERWKASNDGTGDSPHHEHIYWYSAPRGTLCHYQALKQFEDAFDGSEDMWGEEESDSITKIVEGPQKPESCPDHTSPESNCAFCTPGVFDDASHDTEDIVYSISKNQGIVQTRDQFEALFAGNTRLVDLLHDDVAYFTDVFETICTICGLTDESVIRVEKFMLDGDVGYGGQCDIVYEDPSGDSVVADLKTSSGLRQKHRLQSVAYMHAVEAAEWGPDDIDRVEVWRIDPDAEEWQVHSHEVPSHVEDHYDSESPANASYTDAYWFDDKWGDFEYESLEDMWNTFESLVDTAHDESTHQ